MFSITLYLNIQYFNTFRLNIKYDLDYKYVYDGKFMFYADYFSLILKMSICFAHNVEIDSLISFFIIFEFIISIISVIKFTHSNCISFLNCIKGMFYILFNFIYVFYFIIFIKFDFSFYSRRLLFILFLFNFNIFNFYNYYFLYKIS